MAIDRWLASSEALGVVLTAILVAIGRANRPFLRDVARDPERLWRALARIALVAGVAFLAWTALADNWRQLVGLPYRLAQVFPSQRVEIAPPSAGVRAATFVLLGITLVAVACLVARHVGGYFTQIVLLLGALALWLPLFVIRQRFDLNLAFGFGGDAASPLDVIGYLLAVVLAWTFEVALIFVSFTVLLAGVALPITLLLDLVRRRQPRVTTEAGAFFAALSERAGSAGRPR